MRVPDKLDTIRIVSIREIVREISTIVIMLITIRTIRAISTITVKSIKMKMAKMISTIKQRTGIINIPRIGIAVPTKGGEGIWM